MTGPEFLAAASAAGKIASNALAEDDSTKAELLRKAKAEPAFDAAGSAVARKVAVKQEIALQLYRPLAWLMRVNMDYFKSDFGADMAEKIEAVPEENRITPKPSVAIPAMEGLGISLDEPDLKEMYLNLLTQASDDRRAESAHPSFVEVIKQLTAREAYLLRIALGVQLPLVQVRRIPNDAPNEFRVLQSHIANITAVGSGAVVENALVPTYLDNWVRLGLVTIVYDSFLTGLHMYDWAELRPEVIRLRMAVEQEGKAVAEITRGMMSPTAFGRSFAQSVGLYDAASPGEDQGVRFGVPTVS